jgi:phage terminase large subunit-like protein
MLKAGPKTGYDGALPDIEDDVEWFEYVTGATLYTWQREELALLMAPDRPRSYYEQLGRKNGKSYLAAAVGICEARRPGRHIYAISDSEKNLQSALMREIKDIIAASPILAAAYVPFQSKIEVPSTGSFIETRANKFAASQSINPHLVLFDEVHLQKTDDIWHGMRMATAARPDGMVFGITTPGQDVTAPAHGLYEQVRAGTLCGRIFEPSNPATSHEDREQWALANPRLLDDPGFAAALEEDFRDLPEHQFKRYRLGQWTAGESAWFPYGAWDARKVARDLEPGETIWVGFDGSYSGDSTALVAATADGFIQVLGVWENPGRKGWRVPRAEVEDALAVTFATYDVRELLCDPPYWQREISEWEKRWPGKVIEWPTYVRARMAPACTQFYSAVLDGRLTHQDDPRLARHVANAVVRPTPQGDLITKAAQDSPAKIDLAVAAVIAYSRAALAAPRRARIFVR